ncbi:hypothetical protein CTAYLR_003173 [Chrysophaeum taylorii]|uniref:Sulfotransferase family protein n=1 Tax=Chrysophaeum taylorii TaxID=2483200 RepID=A0AAD7XKP5_9STRA|nr:hypothetical protein CTAYLR_003173 [Chrysophaeum taylorii]
MRVGFVLVAVGAVRPNPKKQFAFLHIPKTAGATIEELLGKRERRVNNVTKLGGCVFWHTPPQFLRPNPYAHTPTFCVVREPLDRLLSEFKMYTKGPKINSTRAAVTFMQRVLVRRVPTYVGKDCHYWPQHLWVWDASGACTCRHVLRFERLEHDFDTLMREWGDPDRLRGYRKVKRHHTGSSLTPADIPPDLAMRVRAAYALDMVHFGYGDGRGNLYAVPTNPHVRANDSLRTCVPLADIPAPIRQNHTLSS